MTITFIVNVLRSILCHFFITNHVYSKIHDYDYDYRSFFCIHFLSEFYLQMRTKKWCHRLGWTTIIEQRNRMCYRALPPFKPIRRRRSAQPRFSVRRLSRKNWTLLPMKCLKVSGNWEALFRGPSFVWNRWKRLGTFKNPFMNHPLPLNLSLRHFHWNLIH